MEYSLNEVEKFIEEINASIDKEENDDEKEFLKEQRSSWKKIKSYFSFSNEELENEIVELEDDLVFWGDNPDRDPFGFRWDNAETKREWAEEILASRS